MTPLGRVVWGLVLVAADIRIDSVDVIPDPLGWLLVLGGLVPLSRLDPWFTGATVAAGCALAMSVPDLMTALQGWLGLAYAALQLALVICTCGALLRRLQDPADRRSAGIIRTFSLALAGVLVAVGLTVGVDEVEVSGSAGLPIVVLTLTALAVFVWFLVLLAQVRHDPGFQPSAPVTA